MKKDLTRRDFVKVAGLGAGAVMLPSMSGCAWMQHGAGSTSNGWDRVPEILARISASAIPARTFDVTSYGARGDGQTDCTAAFRAAIAACSAAGGGHVVAVAGRFLTGPIHLRSNVDLHVSAGATIAFTQDPNAYLPPVLTRFEGMELMGYSPLIYALDQENISISGEGTLDGGGDATHWWPWKGGTWGKGPNQNAARAKLVDMAEAGTPAAQRVFGDGSYLRPQFIQPYRCRNVVISGVRIINSPMWEIHPVLCTNVIVRGVTIDTHGPNNDGCDPESCRDVLIEGCTFDTGDDCIAIKSGRNGDGRRIATPTENVIIRNCRMKDGHGGVTIGSEVSGGVRWVFAEKCEMDSPNLERALRFKNNAMRGGLLEHVYMRDVTIGQISDSALSVDLYYEEGQQGPYVPVIRDVEMRNVTSRKSKFVLYMRAYERSEISDVRIVHCDFAGVERGNVTQGVQRLQFEDVRINGVAATPKSNEVAPPPDSEKLPSDLRKPPPFSHPERSEGPAFAGTSRSLAALAMTMALVSAAPVAKAQAVPDTLPKLQLGEGRAQPNGKPLPIPDASRPSVLPPSALPLSVRFVRSVMQRNPQTSRRWDYTQGVVLGAIERVAIARRDTAMLAYVKRNMDLWIKPDGSIESYAPDEFNLDHIAQGQLLFGLYERTKDMRYRKAADRLREQLRAQPRTPEGGFWHKKIYPQQMWLDGLFMAEPFYAHYAGAFGDSAAFDDVARQFLLVARHTIDSRTGLMYHAWDAAHAQPWADTATGVSKNFWARAMGWYMMGVVETLDYLPATHRDRAALIRTLQQAAAGVARVQDPVTGLWWDVIDQPNRAGNYLEASASSMFAYALAKGARLGYLDASYRAVAERGFNGLVANLVRANADGTVSLVNIAQVAGLGGAPRRDGSVRDGSYAYYVSEPVVTDDFKGLGPFVMAALELGR